MTHQFLFNATRVWNEPFLFLFLTCPCNPSFLQGPMPRSVSAATQQYTERAASAADMDREGIQRAKAVS